MKRDRLESFAVIGAIVVTILFNLLANLVPFGGRTTGEVSNLYPTRVTPADYAFAIWSLIFVGLSLFAVYQASPLGRDDARLRSIRSLVVINCAANCAWLLLWHNLFIAGSFAAILVILSTLALIYARLRTTSAPAVPHALIYKNFLLPQATARAAEKIAIETPFAIYFAWITIATILNAAIWLRAVGWDGAGVSAEVWAALLIVAGLVIAVAVHLLLGGAAYMLVFAWAFVATAIAQRDASLVTWTALAATFGVLAVVFVTKRPRMISPRAKID